MSGNGNCCVIRFARNAPRPFCLVHCGVADTKASCGFARGGCQFSHGGDLPPSARGAGRLGEPKNACRPSNAAHAY